MELLKRYPFLKRAEPLLGAVELYPPQKEAIERGVLDGKSLLLASGTGSGKTLVAELAALRMVLHERKKAVYISPLRALSSEKHERFRRYEQIGVTTAISLGGYDSAGADLSPYDIVFLTTEKLDSLLRHRIGWIGDVGLLIVDEIHEICSDRGPALESVIVRMRHECPSLQIVALSATIGNAAELAEWLRAELVESSFRPVPLLEQVYLDGRMGDRRITSQYKAPEMAILVRGRDRFRGSPSS